MTATRASVEPVAGRDYGDRASIIFPVSATPRSNRYRSGWLRATVPELVAFYASRFLPAAAVERLLKRCDRKTAVGRRNHAILLLLARLGVRAGEVIGLSLDDIDWDSGQITIHGKGGKSAQLPLPADVGTAVAAYLRHDRPPSASRRVFLRHRAPLVGFANPSTLSSIVRRALKHAGVESAHMGAMCFATR